MRSWRALFHAISFIPANIDGVTLAGTRVSRYPPPLVETVALYVRASGLQR
jgi:hypothetical protein